MTQPGLAAAAQVHSLPRVLPGHTQAPLAPMHPEASINSDVRRLTVRPKTHWPWVMTVPRQAPREVHRSTSRAHRHMYKVCCKS